MLVKFEFGTSYLDRLGCLDSDGDGASDPSSFWNESFGADLWPNDPTQWADSDGDGFGDNSSQDATNPDFFFQTILQQLTIPIMMAILIVLQSSIMVQTVVDYILMAVR